MNCYLAFFIISLLFQEKKSTGDFTGIYISGTVHKFDIYLPEIKKKKSKPMQF